MANPGVPHVGPVSFRVNQSRPGAAFQLDEL
ncbi:AsnC family transcriptional regulator, partial [Mycobacterium sp. ITM-2017-0098]